MVRKLSSDVPPSVHQFTRRLSLRAQTAVSHWQWLLHPDRRFSHEELTRLLAEKGIPEWPFLWPLEEAFGGVELEMNMNDLDLGIANNLRYFDREELIDEHGQIRFVPMGSRGIYTIFLDASERMYLFHVPNDLMLIDASFESYLENQAMSTSLAAWASQLFIGYFSPKLVSSALASERAVQPVIEASNEFHRWWQDDTWTLYEPGDNGRGTIWARSLSDLVSAIDAASHVEPRIEVKPRPSYEEEHMEVLSKDRIAARAPEPESLRARPGARRFTLLGEPSIYPGKPPSTGDVWISGEGDDLRIDVLERRHDELVNYWQLTPTGSHALLSSRYGRG
jgi:hypothetical protein